MLWSCSSSAGDGAVVRIEQIMTSSKNQFILAQILQAPDSPSSMTQSTTMEGLQTNEIISLEGSSQVPDLNPIQHLWNDLCTGDPLTIWEFWSILCKEEWTIKRLSPCHHRTALPPLPKLPLYHRPTHYSFFLPPLNLSLRSNLKYTFPLLTFPPKLIQLYPTIPIFSAIPILPICFLKFAQVTLK